MTTKIFKIIQGQKTRSDLSFHLHLIHHVTTFIHILTSFDRVLTLTADTLINIYRAH